MSETFNNKSSKYLISPPSKRPLVQLISVKVSTPYHPIAFSQQPRLHCKQQENPYVPQPMKDDFVCAVHGSDQPIIDFCRLMILCDIQVFTLRNSINRTYSIYIKKMPGLKISEMLIYKFIEWCDEFIEYAEVKDHGSALTKPGR
jgi:hypothetical protein